MSRWKFILKAIIGLGVLVVMVATAVNVHIVWQTDSMIHSEPGQAEPAYTAILLGSLVYRDGRLSSIMQMRADKAIELYKAGTVKRLLVSGDHGSKSYDEVNAIKTYLESQGVPERDIFLDHAGFNTYDTMVRAKKIFQVEEAVIISQEFHLPRAVYIAKSIGIKAQGMIAKDPKHLNMARNNNREKLARVKSWGEVQLGLNPKYLGEEIPIHGNSNLSFDR